jgi:TrmH family RNA methyltransferase
MKEITSRENARYRAMAKLVASAAERRKRGLTVLDGAHLVAAFLDSGRRVESAMVSREAMGRREIAELAKRCEPAEVHTVPERLFAPLSTVETATGIVAAARTPESLTVPAGASLVLLLEDVQDPGNVGTLLRSAAAAGAGHVVLSKTCAFAWSPKVLRAGMGAHFALNIVEGTDLLAFLAQYRGTSVALEAGARTALHDLDLGSGPVAVLVGNEGAGLSAEVLRAASVRAKIPMPGRMESLNAAVAGSVCLFEVLRQRTRRRASP